MSVMAEPSVARAHFRVANSNPWRRVVRNSAVAAAETGQSDQPSGPAACGIVRRKAKLERMRYGSVGLGPASLISAVASLALRESFLEHDSQLARLAVIGSFV